MIASPLKPFKLFIHGLDREISVRAGDVLVLAAYMSAGSGGSPANEVTGEFRAIERF